MTKQLLEVITSVERRRRWSREEKERLVAACLESNVSVSEIARSAGIHAGQLFRLRKELCQISAPSVPQFMPVKVVHRTWGLAANRAGQTVTQFSGCRAYRLHAEALGTASRPSSATAGSASPTTRRTCSAWFCNLGVILPMLDRRSKSIIAGICISDAGFAATTAKNASTVGSFISSSCRGMSLPLRPG